MAGDSSFRMTIEGVFTIKGQGIAVTGRVDSGAVRVGDEVYFKGPIGIKKTAVAAFAVFGTLTYAEAGDNIGMVLTEVEVADFKQGDVLAGSVEETSFYD